MAILASSCLCSCSIIALVVVIYDPGYYSSDGDQADGETESRDYHHAMLHPPNPYLKLLDPTSDFGHSIMIPQSYRKPPKVGNRMKDE